MPWCPKCKNEYQDGIKKCADCGCELVESLEEETLKETKDVSLIFGEEEQMSALKEFLEYNGFTGVKFHLEEDSEVCELSVREEDRKKAIQVARIFLKQEEERKASMPPEPQEEEEANSAKMSAGVYQDSAERAEDNRSSAWMLLGVGGIGLVVMALGLAGILPIHLSGLNRYMVYGMMSALFLLFIVMGVVSMKNYKVFAQKAESENTLRDTLNKWCQENLIPETVDAELGLSPEMPNEYIYFKRFEKMKEKLSHQFVNLDEAFLEHFIDEQYDAIFRNRKEEE